MSKLYPEKLKRDFRNTEINEKILSAYDQILMNEAKIINMATMKKVEKGLKDQWKRVHGTGAAAKFGSWILDAYETEKAFLNAPVVVWDGIRGKGGKYPNFKKAIEDFPDLDEFMAGMRGADNRISFERDRKREY